MWSLGVVLHAYAFHATKSSMSVKAQFVGFACIHIKSVQSCFYRPLFISRIVLWSLCVVLHAYPFHATKSSMSVKAQFVGFACIHIKSVQSCFYRPLFYIQDCMLSTDLRPRRSVLSYVLSTDLRHSLHVLSYVLYVLSKKKKKKKKKSVSYEIRVNVISV